MAAKFFASPSVFPAFAVELLKVLERAALEELPTLFERVDEIGAEVTAADWEAIFEEFAVPVEDANPEVTVAVAAILAPLDVVLAAFWRAEEREAGIIHTLAPTEEHK